MLKMTALTTSLTSVHTADTVDGENPFQLQVKMLPLPLCMLLTPFARHSSRQHRLFISSTNLSEEHLFSGGLKYISGNASMQILASWYTSLEKYKCRCFYKSITYFNKQLHDKISLFFSPFASLKFFFFHKMLNKILWTYSWWFVSTEYPRWHGG